MKVLIFGRGLIAEQKYLKYLSKAFKRSWEQKSADLQIFCIDKKKENCFEVDNWENEPQLPIDDISKILILTPPSVHLLNFKSILRRYIDFNLKFPKIYIEKPVYLESQEKSWLNIMDRNSILEENVYYIDHYRFKDSIDFFLDEKKEILAKIGKIKEIAFISLEKQKFWDSSAFSSGYFLEHGCHFFGMLDRIFPEIRHFDFEPYETDRWRMWAQAGRPPQCKEDSAVVLYLKIERPDKDIFSKCLKTTIIISKGMIDKKLLHIGGEKGTCQLFFNENRNIIKTPEFKKTVIREEAVDSYEKVSENIFPLQGDLIHLMPIRKGISHQEKLLAIRRYFPGITEEYGHGELPCEIKQELVRIGVGI